ncbi:MAG: hypothetical protein H0V76_01380 [Blastocatellia bacterium]|nr:hypothetical protein [Blastocatellia bacterium]
MTLERIFQAAAGVFALLGGYFLWNGSNDAAFVSIALGCVAFFLGVRSQTKGRVSVLNEERVAREESVDESTD